MKRKYFIYIILLINYLIFSQDKNIDLYNYDFFGFKMNYSQEQIVKELKKQNKDYVIKNVKDTFNEEIEYVNIFPRNFNATEKLNVDYVFNLYNGKVYSFGKHNIEKSFLDKLLKEIKNYNTISTYDKDRHKEYRTDNFIILYQEINIADAKNLLLITNARIKMEIWEKILINTSKPIFRIKYNNIKLFKKPTTSSESIRDFNLDEKVKLIKFYNSETIDGKEGKWLNVYTGFDETGYVFSEYVEEVKQKKSDSSKKYFSPTVPNLRFRESPDLNGKFIRSLNQGEKLELIEKGKEETINNVKGTWVKVKTEKGEVGWCFDAYLEPYDEVKKSN